MLKVRETCASCATLHGPVRWAVWKRYDGRPVPPPAWPRGAAVNARSGRPALGWARGLRAPASSFAGAGAHIRMWGTRRLISFKELLTRMCSDEGTLIGRIGTSLWRACSTSIRSAHSLELATSRYITTSHKPGQSSTRGAIRYCAAIRFICSAVTTRGSARPCTI